MEAWVGRWLVVLAAFSSVAAGTPNGPAVVRTTNFVVTAPTAEIAKKVAEAAEVYRRELAIEWLGKELPPWYAPCPVRVKVGQIGAGGATTFSFHASANGPDEVCGWDMQIQGSLERILDSVLPHEISHTIFACYFRRPLPRWADEGAATLIEHESERRRQVMTVRQVLGTRRRIPLKTLLSLKEYPKDMQDVMTLYAEGYSLADLLVQKGGKARYLKFLNDAHQRGWENAVQAHYGYKNLDDLEKQWHEWIIAGSPAVSLPEGQLLANAADGKGKRTGFELRGQSPDAEPAPLEDDPFLSHENRRKGKPRTDGPSGTLRDRNARQEVETPVAVATTDRHEGQQPAEEQIATASISSLAGEPGDEVGWSDVPRSQLKNANRRMQAAREAMSSGSERGNLARTAPPRSRGNELPSVVRQRQSISGRIADNREFPERKPRTPWSEFPQETPVGWGGMVGAD